MNPYQFTDTDLAAARLAYVAKVYAPSSEAFIRRTCRDAPQLAVDLGCGPGFSTHMVADATGATRTVGLDSSETFISLARQNASGHTAFFEHDVTSTPFPVGPADFVYCRYLLSHLKDLAGAVGVWADQVRPAGLLLMEEVESIDTTVETLATCLTIVDAMLTDASTALCVGPALDNLAPTRQLRRVSSDVARVSVGVRQAARMFHMNIRSWKKQPFIREHYDENDIEDLQTALGRLASDGGADGEIEWGMRQIVFQRY